LTRPERDRDRAETYPRRFRIRKRREYLALQSGGKRRRSEHFTVITRCRQDNRSRLGITTSRKVGHAPARNRVRRLVREFFRRNRSAIDPPRDVLVIARPGTHLVPYHEIERELRNVLEI
jgi:ribonuclease P protein component